MVVGCATAECGVGGWVMLGAGASGDETTAGWCPYAPLLAGRVCTTLVCVGLPWTCASCRCGGIAVAGVGTLVAIDSGDVWESTRTMSVAQSAGPWCIRSWDGLLLLRREREGWSRMLWSAPVGVDGGVENVSVLSGIGENTACMSRTEAKTAWSR